MKKVKEQLIEKGKDKILDEEYENLKKQYLDILAEVRDFSKIKVNILNVEK